MTLASAHLQSLHAALKSAEVWGKADLERTLELPLADRVALGVSWAGVTLSEAPTQRRRRLRVIVRGSLHPGIGPGDSVVVRSARGRCVSWDLGVAELEFERTTWPDVDGARVVDLGFDADGWIEWRKAIERADDTDTGLKRALLEPAGEAESASDVTPEDNTDDTWPELNESQRIAARTALAADHLAVIHGPPGTGKTRTLVAILKRLTGTRWALAESNAAVDNLAVAAADAGMNVLRVGAPFRMSSDAQALSLDAQVEAGPYAAALDAIDRDIIRARPAGGRALGDLHQQRRELEGVAETQMIEQADVIAMTFGTMMRRGRNLPAVHTSVVDEVTQAIEPSVWAAVPRVQRLILAGDPHQLGPVVSEPGNPLAEGLLPRLRSLGVPMPMLQEQHRMHANIMGLVSEVYGPDYTAHASASGRDLSTLLTTISDDSWMQNAATFVDTLGMGADASDPTSHSHYNEQEIALVEIALRELRAAGLEAEQIAVIAPYSAQVERIAALHVAAGVEVATVNAFQGREAEAVLASFTRSNDRGEMGFVADRRRLTVALTRARRLLWMCGDSLTLGRDSEYADVIARAHPASVWEPPWNAALDT